MTEPAEALLSTRLTERLGIAHPVVSAPMAFAAGGALAAAVTAAGGLGLIGGGYGDAAWLDDQFAAAGNQPVGCGFITWSLAKDPSLLDRALERRPRAVMLSFGDPAPFIPAILEAGAIPICQIQTLAGARAALEAGAAIVVAQGAEAGGHGQTRATMTLVPEVADHLARTGSDALLLAAGGVADGRGLAAALMLGADGVLVGSRFWAAEEALVHPRLHAAALAATGDGTVRQRATDVARGYDWPAENTARVLANAFTARWEGSADEHRRVAEERRADYLAALAAGEADAVGVFVGEAAGLIADVAPAAVLLRRMVAEATSLLDGAARWRAAAAPLT